MNSYFHLKKILQATKQSLRTGTPQQYKDAKFEEYGYGMQRSAKEDQIPLLKTHAICVRPGTMIFRIILWSGGF